MWLENWSRFFIAPATLRTTRQRFKRFRLDSRAARVLFPRMCKWVVTLCAAATPLLAQENPTAYEAMRVVGTQLNRSFVNRVISVTGMHGNPQPEVWRVLLDDRNAPGGLREVEISRGRIVANRMRGRSGPVSVIDTAKLNLDSSGAFSVARSTAEKSHALFATASYMLRNDARGNPVWIVTLEDRSGAPAGAIHIGANRGTVTRTEGLFSGPTGEVVEAERPGDEGEDEEDENILKREIKRAFYRTRDDAIRIFQKVRRSFEDFFYRD